MNIVIASDRQSLLDIAIQEHGNLTGLFEMAIVNDKSITDLLVAGEGIIVNDSDGDNPDVVKYLAKIKPTTEIVQNS